MNPTTLAFGALHRQEAERLQSGDRIQYEANGTTWELAERPVLISRRLAEFDVYGALAQNTESGDILPLYFRFPWNDKDDEPARVDPRFSIIA